MRIKKGFTLSEILIVMTLIGVITMLTVPSLIGNMDKTTKAATLKKAYSTISGAYSQAISLKPTISNLEELTNEMVKYLNIKYYYANNAKAAVHGATAGQGNETNWMITEDGIGYKIIQNLENGICDKNKIDFVTSSTYSDENCCYTIAIDINGPKKGENEDAVTTVNESNKITSISGEVFYVYATKTGISSGNPQWDVSGNNENSSSENEENNNNNQESKKAAALIIEAEN